MVRRRTAPPLPYFARTLRRLLTERGWTVYRLAQVSGVHQGMCGRYYHGRTHNVTLRTVAALAQALGVSVEVFSEPGDARPPEKSANSS